MKRVLAVFAIFGILVIFAPRGSAEATDDLMSAAGVMRFVEREAAPDFEAMDIEGGKVRLRDFRGKIILIDFWATW